MINRIVADVFTWNRCSLVEEAQRRVREEIEGMDDECLRSYYERQFPEEELPGLND